MVLDSDAVVGFLDRDDALHEAASAAIRDLIRSQRLLVSVVTYAEVLTGVRLGHHDEGLVKGFFGDLISEILPVDIAIADIAANFRSQLKSLRMPDALILASAEADPETEVVISGDLKSTKVPGLACRVQLLR